jgi:hypothetical protein
VDGGREMKKMKQREGKQWRTQHHKGRGVSEQKSSSRQKGELLSLLLSVSFAYLIE